MSGRTDYRKVYHKPQNMMEGDKETVSALAGRQPKHKPDRGWPTATLRVATNIVLPIVIAVTTAIGTVNHGAVAVYWYLGTVVGLLINGLISYNKDRTASVARNTAIRSETDLAAALNNTGQPLVSALGSVTACENPDDAEREVAVLIDRAVSLAQSMLGATSDSQTRAAFYSIDGNRLQRKLWHGWAGCTAPRTEFMRGRSEHDDEVVKFVHGENALLVENLEEHPPPHFMDSRGRVYKSFVSVPVRAGNKSYGLLTADSDRAYALNGNHRGFLILIAGVLGAGVAHVEAVAAKRNGASSS
jgi:hypothetical protein